MSDSLGGILARLEEIAAYDGPWKPLRDEAPLLRARLQELRERETRLDDLLVVALVGGSGVGKSTLLNALAGDQLAATSEFRPCTSVPTVYHPPGAVLGMKDWNRVSGSALENLVIIDTPDSDTVEHAHREKVVEALREADVILICGSPEKYLDEATWSLLRPLQGERTMVCVETKADLSTEDVREHWTARLREQGFEVSGYFRISARRSLDRKLTGHAPHGDEFDFARLEAFLRTELSSERARRIKRSNALGLLTKTQQRLTENVVVRRPELESLQTKIGETDKAIARETCTIIGRRLFAEPHLWNYALGREVALRAKGIVGTLYRILEAARSFPARLAQRFSWGGAASAGRQAAAMLNEDGVFAEDITVATDAIRDVYAQRRSELALDWVRAGFEPSDAEAGFTEFHHAVQQRLGFLLRGPARDRVVSRAKWLTCWPLALLVDAPPVAFVGYAGYRIVSDYFMGVVLTSDYFLHSGAVLAILLAVELLLISLISRMCAWSARRRAASDLRAAILSGNLAFLHERAVLTVASSRVRDLEEVQSASV
ncbi:MAG: 50S ribosome-binding GTPase [Candidatus Hydrogenedentes bacterium]|nr:50S ribosome-binding GTPase [Candidatus Hydrogenedentota bacterium]